MQKWPVREHQKTLGLREDLAGLIGSILIDNIGPKPARDKPQTLGGEFVG